MPMTSFSPNRSLASVVATSHDSQSLFGRGSREEPFGSCTRPPLSLGFDYNV